MSLGIEIAVTALRKSSPSGPTPNPNVAYTSLFSAPPSPKTKSVTGAGSALEADWLRGLVKPQLLANVPSSRATTYYFAQAGNDTTGDGSSGNPWKSLSKANSVIAASSGNIRLRFKRGDTWRETQALLVGKNNVTLDDYGSGDKPLLTGFTSYYTSGWSNVSGNTWSRAETTEPAHVILVSDEAGVTFDPLKRENSQANCQSFAKSWAWVSNVLYINTGGANPNSTPYAAIPEASPANGWQVTHDNVRIENLRVYGAGLTKDGTAYGLQVLHASTGVKEVVVVGCDFIYTGYHSIGHITAATNRLLLDNCRVGYCANRNGNGSAGSGDTNPIVSYAGSGGQELWLFDCTVVGGTIPSYDWQAASGQTHGSGAILTHTDDNSATQALVVAAVGTSYPANPYQSRIGTKGFAAPAATDAITEPRAWIIGENVPVGSIFPDLLIANKDRIWINCQYAYNATAGTAYLMAGTNVHPIKGWAYNCTLTINVTGSSSGTIMELWTNNGGSLPYDGIMENCSVRWTGVQRLTSYGSYANSYGSRARHRNCQFGFEKDSGSGNIAFATYGGPINAATFTYNAYANVYDHLAEAGTYWVADANAVNYALNSIIPATAPPNGDVRYGAGTDNDLEYDQAGAARNASRHDIGALTVG